MLQVGSGLIVNITSTIAERPMASIPAALRGGMWHGRACSRDLRRRRLQFDQ
jgi:hypothetical protein